MTNQKALYFMPDISGFTHFVNTTEVEHSIHIIAELLELLLDTNTLQLKLAEIEGDALFMYTTKSVTFEDLLQQTNEMMIAFHTHTKSYENKRICSCGSCKTTHHLQLKFVVHYGDLNFITVKEITKPYGKEVIKTHRLLKNNIPLNEYLLITNSVYELFESKWDTTWKNQSQIYDLHEINYFYKNLESISKSIKVKDEKAVEKQQKQPIATLHKIIDASRETTYQLVSELKYRHLWDKDVKRIEFDENKINRMGTVHNCVLQYGSLHFETISERKENLLTYGERTTEMLFTKHFEYVIQLDKIAENKTALTLTLFATFTTLGNLMQSKMIKMIIKTWQKKLEQLNEIAKHQLHEN